MSTAPNLSLPPLGDTQKAEKYIARLVRLIDQGRVTVIHTDLNKFDLSSMQNHYRVDLGEYDVEVSHSIQPETDKDFYTIIFNSLKKIQDNKTDKVILAYIHLTDDQYKRFKISADEALERQKKVEDARRFVEVMEPLDNVLNNLDPEIASEEQSQLPSRPQVLDIQETDIDQPYSPSLNTFDTPLEDNYPK